jgi:flavin reductase (DIM6/NTAB) family NADH-FMN oxidoreductase RutF
MAELGMAASFTDAMAEVCSPVTVVTTLHEGLAHGTTVSAFASLSLEPPMVTVALDHGSELLAKVRQTRRIGVNVLGRDQDDLAVVFSRKGPDKFVGVDWRLDRGLPRLDRSVVWLECDVADVATGGDHVVLLAMVRSVCVAPAAPLTYHRRRFGTHVVATPVPAPVATAS